MSSLVNTCSPIKHRSIRPLTADVTSPLTVEHVIYSIFIFLVFLSITFTLQLVSYIKRLYPQQPFGQAVVTGAFPPRYRLLIKIITLMSPLQKDRLMHRLRFSDSSCAQKPTSETSRTASPAPVPLSRIISHSVPEADIASAPYRSPVVPTRQVDSTGCKYEAWFNEL